MNFALDQLKTEITSLTARERAELAHFLIQTLEHSLDEGAEAAWEVELTRRAEEIEAANLAGRPAEEVFALIRARHS